LTPAAFGAEEIGIEPLRHLSQFKLIWV